MALPVTLWVGTQRQAFFPGMKVNQPAIFLLMLLPTLAAASVESLLVSFSCNVMKLPFPSLSP